jgi:hypothetical protein
VNEGEAIHLRHRSARPGSLISVVAVAVLLYTFAGFGVFGLQTGSGTIGEDGFRFTAIGTIVWMAPLFTWFVVFLVGDRGPFARLWLKRGTIDITANGIAWSDPCDGAGQVSWDDLAGVSELNARDATLTSFFDREGRTIAMLNRDFRRYESRQWVHVPVAVGAAQPRLFEPIDPRHPERGCVRRDLSGDPARSAP